MNIVQRQVHRASRADRRTLLVAAALGVACAAIVPLGGCLAGGSSRTVESGTYVHPSTLQSVKVGQSTKDNVLMMLGEPSRKIKTDKGGEIWRYFYTKTKKSNGYVLFVFGGSNSESTTQTTAVRFNSEGVVDEIWRDDKGGAALPDVGD
ncbi:MAG: outer membrane protein assembly factor BamE [Phycisphaerales bacterium]|nr:outer membrane protein assembly factor BamE [Phycisphaerales bacterium]